MLDCIERKRHIRGPREIVVASLMTVVVLNVPGAASLNAQTTADNAPMVHAPSMPEWQKAAGGKLEFEVASVRQSSPDAPRRGYDDLMPFDGAPPAKGLFSANLQLFIYVIFAYKIVDASQYQQLMTQLPQWSQTTQFDIEARAEGTPTRDQLRLMLQSLLEDRFKLTMHTEVKQGPVYALVLEKPGKPGPQLQPHPESEVCVAMTDSQTPDAGGTAKRPLFCGLDAWRTPDGQLHLRMVDVTMEQAAGFLSGMGTVFGGMENRPFLDRTGLTGHFDFNLEFTPEKNGPASNAQTDFGGQTAVGAIKNQLGLKLIKQTGPVNAIVIDHVEMPSAN
jgi:uncharacterized protein (TIGR03435 family)